MKFEFKIVINQYPSPRGVFVFIKFTATSRLVLDGIRTCYLHVMEFS